MSAFMVSEKHINTLVSYASRNNISYYFDGMWNEINGKEQEAVDILTIQNCASLNARYNEEYTEEYTYKPQYGATKPVSEMQIVKACHCYNYQACETENYDQTKAAAITKSIESFAIRKVPEYEQAEWELA